MYLNQNKITNLYPCKPTFHFIKWGFPDCSSHVLVIVMLMGNVQSFVEIIFICQDYLWECLKTDFKATFEQLLRWSFMRRTTDLLINDLEKNPAIK